MKPAETLIQERIRVFDERSERRRAHRQQHSAGVGGETLLGRYELLERLGAGGFGVVWRAHDRLLDREVALKRIPLPSEEDRERATREALATARLAHPAIVALYEACSDEHAFYLISELVEGQTLDELISDDALCDEEIFEIGATLADALRHAHGRGVIHRDVKPNNVLVPYREDAVEGCAAKLADFGGARLTGEQALTRAGDVLGTLAYMAPEQSEGHEAGTEADLYSLALVIYEALTGANPVRGRTHAATAKRIGEPIEPLGRVRRNLPRELMRAIDIALHPDPTRRGTLADLQEALEGCPQRDTVARRPAVEDRSAPPEEPKRGSRRIALPRLVWIGSVLAIAVWQAAAGRSGVSLLLVAAAVPLALLARRSGPGWLVAALAPVLGLAGLAGAFPAVAGQRGSWRARAGLAALGFWWLSLAEPLLARQLWEGPPAGMPARAVWEGSLSSTVTHVLGPTLTVGLLLGAGVWAAASAILPWLVRGSSAAVDVIASVAWTVALLAAPSLLERALVSHPLGISPRGMVLGAVLGCAVAICARALRGPA